MDDARAPGSLTEAKASHLLDRAARLDAEGGGRVSVDELREIAMEAGISAESFERALAEVGSSEAEAEAPSAVVVGHRSLLRTLLDRAGLFVTGSALAVTAQILMSDMGMGDEPVTIFILAVAAMIVIWSAITRRRERKVLEFEFDLGVLWFAMTFFFMLMNPSDAGDVLEVMMPAGLLAGILGGLAVATGPDEDQPDQLPERV
jgi:hypothetical protein